MILTSHRKIVAADDIEDTGWYPVKDHNTQDLYAYSRVLRIEPDNSPHRATSVALWHDIRTGKTKIRQIWVRDREYQNPEQVDEQVAQWMEDAMNVRDLLARAEVALQEPPPTQS